MSKIYKVTDLFGNEKTLLVEGKKKSKPNLFSDHEAFVEKFEPKKTTDDCYTPKEVYDVVVEYVGRHYDLTGKQIIRPFYPGGDYESIDYGSDAVVIDNPPFSIITKIARFYIEKSIPFFLFAPHLTLFGSDLDCTRIVCGADIRYENGAIVKTSFLSNMMGGAGVIGDAGLHRGLERIFEGSAVNLPKYVYPRNVLTVSMVAYMVEKGISFSISKSQIKHCRGLYSQKKQGKTIFGSGFLISDSAAMEKAAMEKAAMEKAAMEREDVIVWELSAKERDIIDQLGKK